MFSWRNKRKKSFVSIFTQKKMCDVLFALLRASQAPIQKESAIKRNILFQGGSNFSFFSSSFFRKGIGVLERITKSNLYKFDLLNPTFV